ncbi:MAG: Rpn family recombination-promoting nuclease/putative transposase [Deltaproteobacteria bacterium]|nr:Rpn family recombination-promoting nuclease/putative transposase [Deltaproteobacteria bacterium]
MAEYDQSYKNLFSHPQLVRDLLQGFIKEQWVAGLDLDTLEKVNGSYIADDLREREDDIIWRVRWGKEWIYVYLLLEFQSTVDPYMAVRLLTYVGLLYQDIIKTKQLLGNGKLPPVLPLVLYNGERAWNASRDIGSLIQHIPGGLEQYRPDFQYLLIDESYYQQENLPTSNLVSSIFQLEQSQNPEDVHRVVKRLIEWLKSPEQISLRRAFTVWINRVLLPVRLPGQKVPKVNELMEIETMLAERVKEWTREWKEEGIQLGLQKGLQKGRQEGRQEGLCQALKLLLVRRFGDLPQWYIRKLEQASTEQLEYWTAKIFDANSLEELFGEN